MFIDAIGAVRDITEEAKLIEVVVSQSKEITKLKKDLERAERCSTMWRQDFNDVNQKYEALVKELAEVKGKMKTAHDSLLVAEGQG